MTLDQLRTLLKNWKIFCNENGISKEKYEAEVEYLLWWYEAHK